MSRHFTIFKYPCRKTKSICSELRPSTAPIRVEEPDSLVRQSSIVVVSRTMHPFPRCSKPARENRLSKLEYAIPPQAENTNYPAPIFNFKHECFYFDCTFPVKSLKWTLQKIISKYSVYDKSCTVSNQQLFCGHGVFSRWCFVDAPSLTIKYSYSTRILCCADDQCPEN